VLTVVTQPASQPHRAFRGVAVFCAVLVWLLTLLSGSPQLHAALHGDAAQAEHVCAVTLFSQGTEIPALLILLAAAPVLVVLATLAPSEPWRAESPQDWLLPGRGPPVR
jgi:hypothetical protein